jgi:hypothetical protein
MYATWRHLADLLLISIMTDVNMMLKLVVLHTAKMQISGHSSHVCPLHSVRVGYRNTRGMDA